MSEVNTLLEQLNNLGLCEKAEQFFELIKRLQIFYKEKEGKYFGAKELFNINRIEEIISKFDNKIDTNTVDSLEFKEDKKIYVKDELINGLVDKVWFEFHEHKNEKGEDGFTLYFFIQKGDDRFFMANGEGHESINFNLKLIDYINLD